jgi:hypothetical protein
MSNSNSATIEFACLLAYLLEAQDSSELCYKTIKRKLKSRAMNLPNIAVPRSATTGEIVAADGGRRLCWTIVGKQWQRLSFFFPLAAQSPPGCWLVCVVPVIFILFLFLANHRISGARFSTFLKGQATITSSVFFFQFCEFESLAII